MRISEIIKKYDLPYVVIRRLLDDYYLRDLFIQSPVNYNGNIISVLVLPKNRIIEFETALKIYKYEIKQMKLNYKIEQAKKEGLNYGKRSL